MLAQFEYELQPQIDAAKAKLAEHRLECRAVRERIMKAAPWSPEACDIFQPFDCLLCDVLFMAIVDLMAISRVSVILPSRRASRMSHCPHCKGLGKVQYYHGDLDTCPTCHGSGNVTSERERVSAEPCKCIRCCFCRGNGFTCEVPYEGNQFDWDNRHV
jgi:hypothetical protein